MSCNGIGRKKRIPGRKQELIIENEKLISGHIGSIKLQGENYLKVKCKREVQYMTEGHNDLRE